MSLPLRKRTHEDAFADAPAGEQSPGVKAQESSPAISLSGGHPEKPRTIAEFRAGEHVDVAI